MNRDPNAVIFLGCECETYRELYTKWLQYDAELRIASCMRTCPYCGDSKISASSLRNHLRSARYKAQNLVIIHERHDSGTIRHPSWTALLALQEMTLLTPSQNAARVNSIDTPILSNKSGLAEIRGYLLRLQGFDLNLARLLQTASFDELDNMPMEIQKIWTESTTFPPLRLSAQRCWRSRTPTFEELWLATSRIPKNDIRVFERGQAGGEPATVYCQLAEPDCLNATYIIGARPMPLIRENPFRPPEGFFEIATPQVEQKMTFNITPKYSFIDLHIDYGIDGLSCPMHKCQKIWFMYPPTEKNLSLMATEDGQVAKMIRLSQSLEGGVLFCTSSSDAVYIPSRCIHAVYTVSGGSLVTMDFTTRTSVLPFSKYLNQNLQASLDQNGQRDCYFLYLNCLSVALVNGSQELALKCWISIEYRLPLIAEGDQEWRVAAAAC